MNKWDTFTDMLKEYYLEEFSTMIYMKRKEVEESIPMKQIILETAQDWIQNKPHEGRDIMFQVAETITIENMKKKYEEITQTNIALNKERRSAHDLTTVI